MLYTDSAIIPDNTVHGANMGPTWGRRIFHMDEARQVTMVHFEVFSVYHENNTGVMDCKDTCALFIGHEQ